MKLKILVLVLLVSTVAKAQKIVHYDLNIKDTIVNFSAKTKPADPTNYIYFLKCTLPCGKVFKKGNILLLR